MSRPQDLHRPLFPFGNPFKVMRPKGSYLFPRLVELLNEFEEALADRFRKLMPESREGVLTLTWAVSAMKLLCQTHSDINSLITALELPVCDWDDEWVDLYLDNSIKLLDICIAFSSEFSRLNQGHLLLRCALHYLEASSSGSYAKACSSLGSWEKHISLKNPRLNNCFNILDSLTETLNLLKVKNSAKGKVLMQAMFGVKVFTVFVCRIIASGFSGSVNKLVDIQVPETCLWAKAFCDVQVVVHGEMRAILSNGSVIMPKELEAVNISVKQLYLMARDEENATETPVFQSMKLDLGSKAGKLSEGLDLLAKQVDWFFHTVLRERDALLCNLTVGCSAPDQYKESQKAEGKVASWLQAPVHTDVCCVQ